MKKIILSVLMCCVAMIAAAQVERPKLVVGIVIDQMRWTIYTIITTSMARAV